MDPLWTKVTLTLGLLMVLAFGAIYGGAVEHPRRNARSHNRNISVKVNVSPKDVVMHYGEVVKVKCRARGGTKVEDMPFMSFYRNLGPYTVLPMSSGFPGVTIETIAPGRSSMRHNRSVKYIKLGPEVYQTLYPGENLFYCRGYNMRGEGESSYFTVHKL